MKEKRRNLPLDIIHEILLCLPVKVLTKFRLVCEQWNSLISDASFQRDHYRFHQQNPLLVSVKRKPGCHLISTYNNIKNMNFNRGLTLLNSFSIADSASLCTWASTIQSCLGLVCIESDYGRKLFVCNPSTGEQIVLPPTPEFNECIGFGYVDSTKEFKVVKFYYTLKPIGRTLGCKVLTLGSGDWREARSPPFETLRVCFGIVPFLQGALHLLECKVNDYSQTLRVRFGIAPFLQGNDYLITIFDIKTEEFRQIPAPENYYTDNTLRFGPIQTLSELGGMLSLVGIHDDFLEVWLLKDYNNAQWVKEYRIDLYIVTPTFLIYDDLCGATPLEILADGSITLTLKGLRNNELLCYNPQDKIATYRMEYGKFLLWGLFVESFRSIGGH